MIPRHMMINSALLAPASLADALRRVWDPPCWLPACLQDHARRLYDDRDHGAATLAAWAVELVSLGADGELVAALRPTMVATVNAARAASAAARKGLQFDVEQQLLEAVASAAHAGAALFKPGQRIATFSRSGTIAKYAGARSVLSCAALTPSVVHRCLSHNSAPALAAVYVGESLPGAEGRLMAQDLAAASKLREVTHVLGDDDLIALVAQGPAKVDAVVMGADAVLPNGVVVNKVGSARLAAAAKTAGVPVYVVCDRWKAWDGLYAPPMEDIFEVVPSDTITRVVGCRD